MTKTVLLDVDGVLANFIGSVLDVVRAVTGASYTPEHVTQFDFTKSLDLHADDAREVKRRVSEVPGFWSGLSPFDEAIEGVARLREVAEVVIVTSPWNSCRTWLHDRETWLKRHFDIPHSHVIAANAKHYVTGDFFVDDKTETLVRWRDRNGRIGTAIQWQTPHNRNDEWHGPSTRSWEQLVRWVGGQ